MAGDNIPVKDGDGILQTLGAYWNGLALILRKVQVPSPAPTDGIAPTFSTQLENEHVFKAGAGNLYGFNVFVMQTGWILLFNGPTAPSDGNVTPVDIMECPASATYSYDNGVIPDYYSGGIIACFSTTGPSQSTGLVVKTTPSTGQAFFKGRAQ